MNRRLFLQTAAGALVVRFPMDAQGGPTAGAPAMGQLDSWLAIDAQGAITAYSGKEELGQGIATAQQQLVAEELAVPFDRVRLIYCDTARTPDQAHTSGSQSHPANFNHANLALACATAREHLLRLGAERLRITDAEAEAINGAIVSKADPAKRIGYGELIAGRSFNLALNPNAKRIPPAQWRVLGTEVPMPDLPQLVTARFQHVHNVRVPGMLHGRVVRPPTIGATLINVDEGSVKGMPGLVKVVVKQNFVGVVAEKPFQAMQIAARLKVNWRPSTATLQPFDNFYDSLRSVPSRDTLLADSPALPAQFAAAATTLEATYRHPYQMHGSLGSSCAVADVQGDKMTLWSATQGVWYQKNTAAMITGLKPENVRVIFVRGSGCYGCNGADTVTYDAALLSQAVARPVRVQLTRKDEMAWENFGNAFLMRQRAALDSQGNLIAWDHESWSPGKGGRPGPATPGNIITGELVGFTPPPFTPRTPAPPPGRYNNNSNGIPSYFAVGTGKLAAGRALTHAVASHVFTGPLRSPARLQNTFAHESFLDEIAARAQADPVEYRLRFLKDPRLTAVLQAAAKGYGWDPRPSPRRNAAQNGIAIGRGCACVLYEGDNGYTAMVAEVAVTLATGAIDVRRIVSANDVGPISNPAGLRNQVEGGTLQGMSRALVEEVTWDREKVTSIDWRTYRTLPVGFKVPKIETILLNQTEGEVMGAGETAITLAAPAIANAIFDATGARLRQVPFTPERVKAALAGA